MLKFALAIILATVSAYAQGRTLILQTLVDAAGKRQSGQITIAWPNFVTASSVIVSAGSLSLPIVNGVLAISLYPTIGGVPSNIAYMVKVVVSSGSTTSTSDELWSVPVSATPVTRQSVIVSQVPTFVTSVVPVVIVAEVGNGPDANEDTLMSYSLPAGYLAVPGNYIRVRAHFSVVANVTQGPKVYFGETLVCEGLYLKTAPAESSIDLIVVAVSSSSQKATCFTGDSLNDTYINYSTPAESANLAIVISATGQYAASDFPPAPGPIPNSIIQRLMIIEPGNF